MSGQAPSFTELSEAIAFIARALESGDHGVIADACVKKRGDVIGLPTERESRLHAVQGVAHALGRRTLRSLFADRAFPAHESRFKLGGHGQELGHVHIDFVREGPSWYLEDIWQCR
jgi:hypothetical protein